ncbi:mCG146977 [Mus musculus]|nr:mCG146977 [Mus musculus]
MFIYLENICCGGIKSPHIYCAGEGARRPRSLTSDTGTHSQSCTLVVSLYYNASWLPPSLVRASICEGHLHAEGHLSSV